VTSQQKWDMRWVAAAGIFTAGLATWLQTFVMTTQTPFGALVFTQVLGGVGYAFIWVPLSVVLFKTVPQAEIPSALALTRLIQQIGASAGSAYAATLLDRRYDRALSDLAGSITLHSSAVASLVAEHGAHALTYLGTVVSAEAQNLAAVDATRWFGIFTMLAAVLPFLLRSTSLAAPAVPAPAPPPPAPAVAVPVLREEVARPRELVLR
jgi:DHA2 family multidrug resistance protein